MGTEITITAPDFTLTITGTDVFSGCTYNRFEGWYDVDNVNLNFAPRPNASGSFAPVQTFPSEKVVSIEGSYFGASRADAIDMRENLTMLYNDGLPVTVTVADDLRTTSREMLVESVRFFPWTIHPEFEFSIDMKAADVRRYEAEAAVSTFLAAPGEGLPWPVLWPLNWGTIGTTGRVTIVNTGKAATVSRYVITGGSMADGFAIVNVETGERLTYVGPLADGTTIELDSTTRTATINGTGTGTRYLSAPEWWAIPRQSSVEVQFISLGGTVTGAPTLTVHTAPAFH